MLRGINIGGFRHLCIDQAANGEGGELMIYLVDPKDDQIVSWCPWNCPDFGPAPMYGIDPCYSYAG
jgi:hypothetical protein